MQQLVADHRNFATFLDILEAQADRLSSGENADLEISELILVYLQRYADQCHHPREDLLYARLRKKNAAAAQQSAALGEEHAAIERQTHATLEVVRRGAGGESMDAYAVGERLLELVSAYRAHFEAENASLFPAAAEHLSADDWAEAEREASFLSGAERVLHVQERFLALRDYIHRLDRLNP